MLERDIRKALKARVEAYGGEIRAVAWVGRRNAPDVMCFFPEACRARGYYTAPQHPFVETKAPGGVPTDAQLREHARMRAANCIVLIISTIGQLDAWLPPL